MRKYKGFKVFFAVVLIFQLIFTSAIPGNTVNALSNEIKSVIGDCNEDGKVSIDDLTILSLSYESSSETSRYDLRADLDQNQKVDMLDLSMLAANYGAGEPELPILVTGITLTSPSTTVSMDSTMQMNAVITPVNAANREVTWAVIPGTGNASIDSSGLVTGLEAGSVVIMATARDGSNVYGTKEIIVLSAERTAEGYLSLFPNQFIIGDTNNINLRYTTEHDYSAGSVKFILPEEFTIEDTDLINVSSGSYISSIAGLGEQAVISEDRRSVTILNVIYDTIKQIELMLRDRVIASVGAYIFSARGDQDGPREAYLPTLGTGNETRTVTAVQGGNIRGTVSLPNAQVAPGGGIRVTVRAAISTSPTNPPTTPKIVTVLIPEGQSSVAYSIKVPYGSYHIRYSVSNINYIPSGYYSSEGTVDSLNKATAVQVQALDIENINMTLMTGTNISGAIALPNGETAPAGGMEMIVIAEGAGIFSKSVTIPAGQNSVSYFLNVSAGSYKLRYSIASDAYVTSGYYSASGMVSNSGEATIVNVTSTGVTNIHMSLLKGNRISGTISLPSDKTAPTGGIAVSVQAVDAISSSTMRNIYSKTITIPEGQRSANYALMVVPGQYEVNYHASQEPYLFTGYYSGAGTVPYSFMGTNISVASGDANNVNLILLEGRTIRGTISLPNGTLAPLGGVAVSVGAMTGGNGVYTGYTIPAGSNSVEYEIRVATGSYSVGFLTNQAGYASRGYYSETGTVSSKLNAAVIEVGAENIENINMTLLEGKAIQGTLRLPAGQVAPAGGISVSIGTQTNNEGTYYGYTIPAGQSSVSYRLQVIPGSYKVGYGTTNAEYVSLGYYSSTGTIADINMATTIQVEASDIASIDMTLIKGCKITGTVSLPNGQVAPPGGVLINIYDFGASSGSTVSVKVPEGQNAINYALRVAPGTHRICYLTIIGLYKPIGYYSDSGTVESYLSAKPIEVTTQDIHDVNMELIPK